MKKRSPALLAWYNSERLRQIGRDSCKKARALLASRPRCGAKTRTTGEPCKKPGMADGRCELHGGRTPKGKNWHRVRWPDRNAPDAIDKMNRKSVDREKAARKRAKRLARMSPERRAQHDAWHASHRPGDPKARASERERRRRDREARDLINAARERDSGQQTTPLAPIGRTNGEKPVAHVADVDFRAFTQGVFG